MFNVVKMGCVYPCRDTDVSLLLDIVTDFHVLCNYIPSLKWYMNFENWGQFCHSIPNAKFIEICLFGHWQRNSISLGSLIQGVSFLTLPLIANSFATFRYCTQSV